MKNFTRFAFLLALFCSHQAVAQFEPTNANPNTETAYLNNDSKFRQSGFEFLDGGPINLQPGIPGMLRYHFEEDYDYIFIAISDTLNDCVGLAGKPVEFNNDMFDTNAEYCFTEFGSRVVVLPLPDGMVGNVVIKPTLLGKTPPKEDCYYILMRKKKSY